MIITKVHPTLNELCGISKNISDSILAKLNSTVESLKEEKQTQLEKVNITINVVVTSGSTMQASVTESSSLSTEKNTHLKWHHSTCGYKLEIQQMGNQRNE